MTGNTYFDYSLDSVLYKFGYDRDGLRVYDMIAFKLRTLFLLGVETCKTSKKAKILDFCNVVVKSSTGQELQRTKSCNDFGYFNNAVDILNVLRAVGHDKGLILTCNSLSGKLASLVGIKYTLPAIAFASAGYAHIANIWNNTILLKWKTIYCKSECAMIRFKEGFVIEHTDSAVFLSNASKKKNATSEDCFA